MTGRLISLVAIPLSAAGHVLFWMGSANLLNGARELEDLGALVAGIVLIAAGVATVALGSVGAIVIGTVLLGFSLTLFLVPLDSKGTFSPALQLMNLVRPINVDAGLGLYFYAPTGFAFLVGAIFLVAGLVTRARRRPGSIEVRVGAGIAGMLAVIGVLMAVAGGARLFAHFVARGGGPDLLGVIVVIVGTVLVSASVLLGRWTSTAALAGGAVTTLLGLAGLASPSPLRALAGSWPELVRGIELAGPSGSLLLIGVLLIVAGFAQRWRAPRDSGGSPSTPTTATSV